MKTPTDVLTSVDYLVYMLCSINQTSIVHDSIFKILYLLTRRILKQKNNKQSIHKGSITWTEVDLIIKVNNLRYAAQLIY